MPSNALERWQSLTAHRLAVLHRALDHAAGESTTDADAADQADQAFVIMLAAHFQGFCRDLHNECALHLVTYAESQSIDLARIVQARLTEGRRLSQGAANSATIAADFSRFGIPFWAESEFSNPTIAMDRAALDEMASARNALAHQDFARLPGQRPPEVSPATIERWRAACDALAVAIDAAMCQILLRYIGADWRWSTQR